LGAFSRRGLPLVGSFSPERRSNEEHNALRVRPGDQSLTASGMRVRQRDGEILRRILQPWQTRAFVYYDRLGEIKYAAQFYSRALASLELYAAEIVENEEGQQEVKPTDNEQAIEQLDRIQDPGGGRSGLLSSYGRLMFLAGECLLFVSHNPETDREQW
jgi:hypothetical protein